MGIMRQLQGLSKEEKEKAHKEYLEARNRLKEAQTYKPTKKPRTRKPNQNGKVTTYNIKDL